jgi:hypothetical protein
MAKHSLRIDFDESTGALRVTHRCEVEVAGQKVSHAEVVALAEPADVAISLAGLLRDNRAEMEGRAMQLAVQHVAAVGNQNEKGKKRVALGGTLGPIGEKK